MKPKKIVLEREKFSEDVKGAIIVMANELQIPMGAGMGLAKAYFLGKGKVQAEVMVADFAAARGEIIAMYRKQNEEKKPADKLPLNDKAQHDWDPPIQRWKGEFTVREVFSRFAAEIKDGVDLTPSMLDAFAAEKKAEKAAIAALVDERPDPDPAVAGKLMPCGAVRHHGNNEPAVMQQRFLLEKGSDGKLRRRQHEKGDGGYIVAGELLRADEKAFPGGVPPGVIKIEEPDMVAFGVRYCGPCRAAALEDFRARKELPRDHPDWVEERAVLTFYTVAGLRLVTKREVESAVRIGQARNLESAGARTFGGSYGTRKDKRNWHVTRGKR